MTFLFNSNSLLQFLRNQNRLTIPLLLHTHTLLCAHKHTHTHTTHTHTHTHSLPQCNVNRPLHVERCCTTLTDSCTAHFQSLHSMLRLPSHNPLTACVTLTYIPPHPFLSIANACSHLCGHIQSINQC